MFRVTAIYPNESGSRFDAADYAGRHAALARRLLEPHGLLGLDLRLGEAALDGAPPPFWAVAEMRFATRAAFDLAMAAAGAALFADAATYTDVAPTLQISRTPAAEEP